MIYINRFPALLLAGPPHTGKSVLAYHLTKYLKHQAVPFILFRTAPDGEGDWFLETDPKTAIHLRTDAKGTFTPRLIQRATRAIRQRQMPMLVDVGGKPQGDQWLIPKMCSHYILLYRETTDRNVWQSQLDALGLLPVARLHSDLTGKDDIQEHEGVLEGDIAGLDRSAPNLGTAFRTLAARVHDIFDYTIEEIEAIHLAQAPAGVQVVTIHELAREIGVKQQGRGDYWWEPGDLNKVGAALPIGGSIGLYGRGPVWLTAAIALMVPDFWLFDARHFGWMQPPQVVVDSLTQNEEMTFHFQKEGEIIRLKIALHEWFILPEPVHLPSPPPGSAVILDGKAPAWLHAALARALRPFYQRLYLFEPRTRHREERRIRIG